MTTKRKGVQGIFDGWHLCQCHKDNDMTGLRAIGLWIFVSFIWDKGLMSHDGTKLVARRIVTTSYEYGSGEFSK